MNNRAVKLLKNYAIHHKPDGSKVMEIKSKSGGITRFYDGHHQFLKALKRDYKRGLFTLDEIEKELEYERRKKTQRI